MSTYFSAADKRELAQYWHTARIAGYTSRIDRLNYAAREFHKAHPEVSQKAAYLEIEHSTRGYGWNPKRGQAMAKKHYPPGIPFVYYGPFKTFEKAVRAKAKISPSLSPTVIVNGSGNKQTWSVMYHDTKRWKKANPMNKSRKRKGLPAGLCRYMAAQRKKKRARKAKRNPPGTVMKRFRRHTLRSSSGRLVRRKPVARTILLSELRRAGYAVAPKKNPSRKRRGKRSTRKPIRNLSMPGTFNKKQVSALKRLVHRLTGQRVVVNR